MTAKKLYLRSFGCQMNDYDSEKIADLLAQNGYERTEDVHEADLVVFNTCSIREKAQEKVFSDLGRVREAKKEAGKDDMVIAVGGCVASQEGKKILTRAPYVNIVFGPQTLHRLPQMIAKHEETHKPQVDITFPEIEKFDHLAEPHARGACAFVSIMEGCSKYCSYCVVPYTRGEEISRPLVDVLLEVAKLAAQGVKEVTLLGQNVNAYRGKTPDGEIADFATLLEYVAEIDGIERIRYTTSHPRLKAIRPDISIATDIIVGFPGETEDDFQATLKLMDDVGFDASFSFVYSRRPGTPAAYLPDDTPQEVKLKRLQLLQAKNEAKATEISRAMLGTEQRVLVIGRARRGEGLLSARTDNNRIVNFPGDERLIDQMVTVKITEVFPHTLGGELIAD